MFETLEIFVSKIHEVCVYVKTNFKMSAVGKKKRKSTTTIFNSSESKNLSLWGPSAAQQQSFSLAV